MTKKSAMPPAVYGAAAVYVLSSFSLLALGDRVAAFAYPEDHYFENVGALSFFAAAILFLSSFLRARGPELTGRIFWLKKLAFLGLALLFFFGAGEEISWGQRLFQIQTPDSLSAINVQGELNVHNIALFEYQIPFETLFDLLWLSLAVLLPCAAAVVGRLERLVPIVHWGVGALFLFDYLLAKAAKVLFASIYTYDPISLKQAVQETKESNYAVIFAVFALYVFLDLKRLRNESVAPP